MKFPGRYSTDILLELLRAIWQAGRLSLKRTEAERKSRFIRYSMSHDFREGFRPREHGMDAHSIAGIALRNVEARIEIEKREQEIAYLESLQSATEEAQRRISNRLRELSARRGSYAEDRQKVIDTAKRRSEIRVAG